VRDHPTRWAAAVGGVLLGKGKLGGFGHSHEL
jgi:hypothetical protein